MSIMTKGKSTSLLNSKKGVMIVRYTRNYDDWRTDCPEEGDEICPICRGDGWSETALRHRCPTCNGTGMVDREEEEFQEEPQEEEAG